MKTFVLIVSILLAGQICHAQQPKDVSSITIYNPDGSPTELGYLVQDNSPMLWVILQPNQNASETNINTIKETMLLDLGNMNVDQYRTHFGVHTLFLFRMSSEDIKNGQLKTFILNSNIKDISAPCFAFDSNELIDAFGLESLPATMIFDGKRQLIFNKEGLISKDTLNAIIHNFPYLGSDDRPSSKTDEVNPILYYQLIGKKSTELIGVLGLPEKVLWEVKGAGTKQSSYPGSNNKGDLYCYPGVSLKLLNDVIAEVHFDNDFEKPLFGDIKMGFHRAKIEAILGPPEHTHTTGDVGIGGVDHTEYFNKGMLINYLHRSNDLIGLSILNQAGLVAFSKAIEKRNIEKRKTIIAQSTLDNLAQYLLASDYHITSTFGAPEAPVQENGGNKDYYYMSYGFAFSLNVEQNKTFAITLFAKSDMTNEYPHALPDSLKWTSTIGEIKSLFGSPAQEVTQEGMTILDYGQSKGYVLYFNTSTKQLSRIQIYYTLKDKLLKK